MDFLRRFFRPSTRKEDIPLLAASLAETAVSEEKAETPTKTAEQRREEIEAFVRNIVARIEGAAALGMTTPEAIAAHFNETGITTRKGRGWTGETVAKFLSSPGAKRYRSKFNKEWRHEIK